MTGRYLFVAAAIAVLTVTGYFYFPGHTFLHSDTQIYMPILEHYWDPTVFTHEILALRPHVAFTIYDEVALSLRKLTHMEFRGVLEFEQLIFRALGLLGVYLIATSFKLSTKMALLVTSTFALGATIVGPAVLTLEYEPVPRGFAVPLLLLAIGLVAHDWDLAAGIAASVAFLYHAPTTYTFWAVYFCMSLWPTRPAVMSRRIAGLLPLLAGALVLFVFSRLQPGVVEPQDLFSRIDPELERLQRLRASYVWVSLWPAEWFWQYAFLSGVCAAAYLRLRKLVDEDLKFFLVGVPLMGALSIPLSYFLLEKLKWTMIPQVQPTRAVLFITALAGILSAIAGIRAAQSRRYVEGILWLAVCFAIPANPRILEVLLPRLADPIVQRNVLLVLGLTALACLAAWAESTRKKWASAPWLAATLLPIFLIPTFGNVRNYPQLNSPELDELSRWARTSTPKDAMFLFPDADRALYPGIFRANSLRAIYVDWKAGGQVNFLRKLGEEWWRRWQLAMAGKFDSSLTRYSVLGIDYVVVRPADKITHQYPLFSNSQYLVYRVPH